jgi:hypothetical protein
MATAHRLFLRSLADKHGNRCAYCGCSIAARIPTPRNRAARTARLADLLARYSPRAAGVLRADRKPRRSAQ